MAHASHLVLVISLLGACAGNEGAVRSDQRVPTAQPSDPSGPPEDSAESSLEEAEQLFYRGERHKAIRLVAQVIKEQSNEVPEATAASRLPAIFLLGEFLLRDAQYKRAEIVFKKASRLSRQADDGSAQFHALEALAMTYDGLGRHDEAERIFRDFVETTDAHKKIENELQARALVNLGNNLDIQKRYDESLAIFKRLESRIDKAPAQVVGGVYMGLGNAYDGLGRPELALPWYQKALDAELKHWGDESIRVSGAWVNLAIAQSKVGRLEGALKSISHAIELRKKHLRSDHPQLVKALELRSDIEDAISNR